MSRRDNDTDRAMTKEEFMDFDQEVAMERHRVLLIDLNDRLEKVEEICGAIENWIRTRHIREEKGRG